MRRRWPVIALTSVVVLGTGTAYAVTGSDPAARYRTVAASTADVEQTLSLSGLVDAAKRVDLSFGTDGTVAALEVALGDTVQAGQVIAKLDAGDLDAALTQAKAELARAVAQLAADRSAQASAVSDSGSSPTTPSSPTPTTPTNDDAAATAKLLKALKKAQDQVIVAQSNASQAIAAAKQALTAQQAACTAAATADRPDGSDGSDGADDPDTACADALTAVQQAQDVVSDAQDALAKALDELGTMLGKALGSANTSNSKAAADDSAVASSDDSSADKTSDTPSSNGGTVTAAQLASDQANIEQANAAVITARQNRAQATVRSTRSGAVVALDVAVGDTVSAGDAAATVVGGTAVTVTGTVGESQVDSVKVGQTVRVSVPGISKATTGKVTAIGLVADSSSGTTSYPVTVTVEQPTISLPPGSRALMQIVVATAQDVVTVPTSAVTRSGTGTAATVRTWNGSTLATKQVQVGAVGSREVAITSGLTAGTRVVLAAIDDPIKGASSEINDRGGFGPAIEFRGPAGGGGGPVTFSKAG
jgi:HlyD family secretion protein